MNHEQFLEAIRDQPDDEGLRLAYADWLDEHGEMHATEYLRLEHQLAELSRCNPDYPWRYSRLMQFGRHGEWSWQRCVSRCELIDANRYPRLRRFLVNLLEAVQQSPGATLDELLQTLCGRPASPWNTPPATANLPWLPR